MSNIIAKTNSDGTVTAAYVAYDEFPNAIGVTLSEHYSDAKKVEKLFALGSLLFVAPQIGKRHNFHTAAKQHPNWTCAYGRDNGVENENVVLENVAELIAYAHTSYYQIVHLYTNGAWNILRTERVFVPLKKVG